MFCKHELKFIRNIYGDEINDKYGKRSMYRCSRCGKVLYGENLFGERTIEEIRKDIKRGVHPDIAIPDAENVSDGYHTFKELYHQRTILFATICNFCQEKAWKTQKHSDGQDCPEGYFVAGIDTIQGNFTYHCEMKYWDIFEVEEIEKARWDGHTEKEVGRLLSLNCH